MLVGNFLTTALVIFVCAQPVFWIIALRRYKRYMNIRFQRLENQLSLISDCLGMDNEANESLEVVRDLVNADLKLEAIELFCQRTGVGLTEAQRAIQAIEKGQL